MSNAKPKNPYPMPYVNRWELVLLTVAINALVAFVFHSKEIVTWRDYVLDAVNCGIITSFINIFYAHYYVRKLRRQGALPQHIPQNQFMRRLPKNPLLLALVFAIFFGALMTVVSIAVAWFYGIDTFPFYRFMAWKIVYSFILTVKIVELSVLRFVQEDCATPTDPPQTGSDVIKNPLSSRESFSNLFNTVVNDFGFNLVIGLLLGGVVIANYNVIITPTTRSGIILGGLILGVIVTFRMTLPVVRRIKAMRDAGELPPLEEVTKAIVWIPEKPILFALTLLVPIMAFSAISLWGILTFLGFEVLNFFQYFVVRTIFVSFLLTKPVTMLAVVRYRQPINN